VDFLLGREEAHAPKPLSPFIIPIPETRKILRGESWPPVMVGHGLGAVLVQKYLESHPAKAAVLVSPVSPSKFKVPSEWLSQAGDRADGHAFLAS
jgi:pimeloyl-ACP methyl ester carboxylesterase